MKIVLDTNILVRAFSNPLGPANRLLNQLLADQHRLILSRDLLFEVARVLRYARVLKIHRQNEEVIYDFIGWLSEAAVMVDLDWMVQTAIRDSNDAVILMTAIIGEANFICTIDKDFYSPPASIYLAKNNIEVLTDVQLLARL